MEKTPKEMLKAYVDSQKFSSTTEIMDAMNEMFRDLHLLVYLLRCVDRLATQADHFRDIDHITVTEHLFALLVSRYAHENAVVLAFVCDEDRLAGCFGKL